MSQEPGWEDAGEAEWSTEGLDAMLLELPPENFDHSQLMALVKNLKGKQQKSGKAKGKGKTRKCFECDPVWPLAAPNVLLKTRLEMPAWLSLAARTTVHD